ncbi:hypothetical protein C2S51_000071 [Perilla frutescens var. frutescens]|nr:hypothetical protein C2S51_000071 [Perilla frutescens var. frutescens]
MEEYSSGCPQLLDLIPKDREWVRKRAEETKRHGISEERKLELSLGPPGGEWTIKESNTTSVSISISRERDRDRLLSLGYFPTTTSSPCSPWHHFHYLQSGQGQIAVNKESSQSQPCSNRAAAEHQTAENKAFSAAAAAANTAVHTTGSAQKRTAPAPVVGWPPIRSFRKNIANGTSSKVAPDVAPSKVPTPKSAENRTKSPFVKINMDGIPIGRKVDLEAYNSYEKLSFGVDELFRGLVAAQKQDDEGGKGIGGLLDGSGEYTLVYEDNEGDRMLVGDVPWLMFVSTVKRLRVLKTADLPALSRGRKQGKLSMNV